MSERSLKDILFTADGIKDKPMETDEEQLYTESDLCAAEAAAYEKAAEVSWNPGDAPLTAERAESINRIRALITPDRQLALAAHDAEIAVITRRNVVDDIETGCTDPATPSEIREALRVHDADIVGKFVALQSKWRQEGDDLGDHNKNVHHAFADELLALCHALGYVDPAKREEAVRE